MNESYEPGILDTSDEMGMMVEPMEEMSGYIKDDILKELKHSIRLHLMIMNGPTQQLCGMLLKCIDLLGDKNEDRRNKDATELAFTIVEGLALYVQRSVDERSKRAKSQGLLFPDYVQASGDNILVEIGKNRSIEDKLIGKQKVLRSIAEALRALSAYTKIIYQDIYDCDGNQL